ncbi:MAG: DpnII family type II restriction endonuclease [Alphaproteobacteria bacterium]
MEKDFNSFIFQLCETNKTLGFFVDFNKVTLNLEKISVKLNQLNYLLGKENIRDAIEILYKENPKCFNVLNILIAARNKKEKVMRATEDRQAVNLDYFF